MNLIISTILPHHAFIPAEHHKSIAALKEYEFLFTEGPSLQWNRNQVFNSLKGKDQDLLFIDSDIVFTLEDVKKIEEHLKTKDVITGIYELSFINEWKPAIFKRIAGDYLYTEPPKGTEQIGACGAGFLGISKRVIETLTSPFENYDDGKVKHEEDVAFCHRCFLKGFKIWCDPQIKLGHVRTLIKYPQ